MSDINQEQYELQQRENCLEEIAKEIPEHYDGDTLDGLDGIVDNVWNKVVKTSETYMKYIGHRYESTAIITICIANHNRKSDSVWWIVLPELHLLFVSPPRVVRA